MMKLFIALWFALLTSNLSLAQSSSVRELLATIDAGTPDSECPECGLNRDGLIKAARDLKARSSTIQQSINERRRKVGYSNANLNEKELAEQAMDKIKMLQAEVDRLKILNEMNKQDLNSCMDKASGSNSRPPLHKNGAVQ